MIQLFSFASKCLKCGRDCMIETYNRGELRRLLELGQAIDACCAECNVRWPIGPEVRAQIAAVVTVESFNPLSTRTRHLIDLTLLPLARVYRWQRRR